MFLITFVFCFNLFFNLLFWNVNTTEKDSIKSKRSLINSYHLHRLILLYH